MNRFLAFLFGAGYVPFSSFLTRLLAPTLRTFALDYATLNIVLGHVAAGTVPQSPSGGYTAADLAGMVADLTELVGGVIAEYQLAGVITGSQLSRLLATIAANATVDP